MGRRGRRRNSERSKVASRTEKKARRRKQRRVGTTRVADADARDGTVGAKGRRGKRGEVVSRRKQVMKRKERKEGKNKSAILILFSGRVLVRFVLFDLSPHGEELSVRHRAVAVRVDLLDELASNLTVGLQHSLDLLSTGENRQTTEDDHGHGETL